MLQGRRRLSPRSLLISACDAGSANVFAAVLAGWSGSYSFWTQGVASEKLAGTDIPFEAVPEDVDAFDWIARDDIAERLSGFSAVLTGTSWGKTLDKAVIVAARKAGLPTASVIEHWSLYRERFSTVKDGCIIEPDIYMPDRIWVVDGQAATAGTNAGLPPAKLVEVGQPYLERRRQQLQSIRPADIGDSVVFVSERLRDDFRKGSPLYPGFDEFEAVALMADAAHAAGLKLIVKLHPQEDVTKFDTLLAGKPGVTVLRDADVEALICGAGKVVGMLSMLLLEAALIRGDVISFVPGAKPDVFIGNRLGATTPATDTASLLQLLRAPRSAASDDFGTRFDGSCMRFRTEMDALLTCA